MEKKKSKKRGAIRPSRGERRTGKNADDNPAFPTSGWDNESCTSPLLLVRPTKIQQNEEKSKEINDSSVIRGKKKVQNNWKKEKEEINKKRLIPWAKMIQFPLNMGPAPCVNMPLCKPARGLGIGKLRHTWCSQHPRTALNPTGVGSGVDGPSSIHAKSHTGHWFRKAKTLGSPALVLTPEEDSTFQCSAICPAASLPALNPTGNLFPFNGFTVKWKAPGHKSSLGLEGVRIIVAIKRRALSLNIPMHSLFFFPFFQQL